MNRINPANQTPGEPLSFKPEVLAALRAFRAEKPWRGTRDERVIKFDRLHRDLCGIYELQWTFDYSRVPELELEHGNGGLDREGQAIVLIGKLSVVTYLFCLGGILFNDREKALSWATGLYRITFPLSAHRMTYQNGLVLKPDASRN